MRAARHRVLVDAHLRREDPRHEIVILLRIGRSGDNEHIGGEASDSGQIRFQGADRVLVGNPDQQEVVPASAGPLNPSAEHLFQPCRRLDLGRRPDGEVHPERAIFTPTDGEDTAAG